MRKLPLLLDCDPGVDDAVAILLSKYLTSLELVAVTSVAGNVEVEHTTQNALDLLELAGLGHIPVYRGAEKPLFGTALTAPQVHGQNGLNGFRFRLPAVSRRNCPPGTRFTKPQNALKVNSRSSPSGL